MEKTDVILDISARHVHLRPEDVQTLFGRPDALTLRQGPIHSAFAGMGQEVFNERVELVGPKGSIKNVTILGPLRSYAQVEVSETDTRALGIEAVVRKSGDHDGTPGISIVGPAGVLKLDRGCIVARRHVHMSDAMARQLGHKNGDAIGVEVKDTGRALIFKDVFIESCPAEEMPTVMHLDTDEGNAAGIRSGMLGTLLV